MASVDLPSTPVKRRAEALRLRAEGMDAPSVRRALGIPPTTWRRWMDDEAFRLAWGRARPGTVQLEPVPGFLAFRHRHFAYRSHRTKRWSVARPSWYIADATRNLDRHHRLIMVLPPGHLKTTVFSIERSVWHLVRDRDWRGIIVQRNQAEARKVVAAVQERLQCDYYHFAAERLADQGDEPIDCPICRWGRPPFKPDAKGAERKWGADGFRVQGRTSGEKDDSFQALGAGSQIQGIRADSIVLDDVQDPLEAMRSPRASAELLDWFHAVILGRVTDQQQVVVLANFITPDDFAHRLIAAHPDWPVVNYPAFITCPTCQAPPAAECDHMDDRVLAPEFWTPEGLRAKRQEVGEQRWYYTWIQEEGDFDRRTFRREALEQAREPALRLGVVPAEVTDIFLGVDPAISAAGFCAMVVWGLDRRTRRRWLIDVFNEPGLATWDNVIAQIERFLQQYPIRVVVIETNNTQRSLANSPDLFRRIASAGARLECYQTVSGTGQRSEQTNFDITTIGGLFDAGLVTLPYGGSPDDRARVDAYIEQLVSWRTDAEGRSIKYLVRDMVMATLFAESEAHRIVTTPPRQPQPRRGLPIWVRGRRRTLPAAWRRRDAPLTASSGWSP